jgi:hypothetical protein
VLEKTGCRSGVDALSDVSERPATGAQTLYKASLDQGGDNNLTVSYVVSPALDREELARAFQAVVERHAALRTQIVADSGEVLQRIVEPARAARACQLESRGAVTTVDDAKRRVLALHAVPVVADAVPQLRIAEDGFAENSLVTFTFAHTVCDGESLNVALRDFWYAIEHPGSPWRYESVSDTTSAGFEPVTDTRVTAISDEFRGSQPLVGLDRTTGRESRRRLALLDQAFDRTFARALLEGDPEWGPTASIIMLGLLGVAIRDSVGQHDLCVGLVRSRRRPETAHVMGDFARVLPVRLQLPAGGRESIARAVRRGLARADRAWGDVDPLELHQHLERQEQSESLGDFNDVELNIFDSSAGWRFRPLGVRGHQVDLLMPQMEPNYNFEMSDGRHALRVTIVVVLREDAVQVRWIYDAGWCEEVQVKRVAESFAELARAVGRSAAGCEA